jgi:hypothetical protein
MDLGTCRVQEYAHRPQERFRIRASAAAVVLTAVGALENAKALAPSVEIDVQR